MRKINSGIRKAIAGMYRSGMLQSEIASKLDVSIGFVSLSLKAEGVSRLEGGKHKRMLDEAREVSKKYIAGLTQDGISREKGVDQPTVNRRLRLLGMSRLMSGRTLRTLGCSVAEYIRLTGSSDPGLASDYSVQRNNAIRRGIPFDMRFPEWYAIWKSSGKLARRGKTLHCYVMARKGDKGPYAKGNVEIITASNNIKNGHKYRKGAL